MMSFFGICNGASRRLIRTRCINVALGNAVGYIYDEVVSTMRVLLCAREIYVRWLDSNYLLIGSMRFLETRKTLDWNLHSNYSVLLLIFRNYLHIQIQYNYSHVVATLGNSFALNPRSSNTASLPNNMSVFPYHTPNTIHTLGTYL